MKRKARWQTECPLSSRLWNNECYFLMLIDKINNPRKESCSLPWKEWMNEWIIRNKSNINVASPVELSSVFYGKANFSDGGGNSMHLNCCNRYDITTMIRRGTAIAKKKQISHCTYLSHRSCHQSQQPYIQSSFFMCYWSRPLNWFAPIKTSIPVSTCPLNKT